MTEVPPLYRVFNERRRIKADVFLYNLLAIYKDIYTAGSGEGRKTNNRGKTNSDLSFKVSVSEKGVKG